MRTGVLIVGLALAFGAGWLARSARESGVPGDAEPAPKRAETRPNSGTVDATHAELRGRIAESGAQIDPPPESGPDRSERPLSVGEKADPVVGAADSEETRTDLLAARDLIARVRPHLDLRGVSYLDLWRELDAALESGAHDWIFGMSGATAAARHEWALFLATHDAEVTAFLEAAYVHMGTHRLDGEDISLSGLQLLAPDLGAHLVATLPVERFRVLRERVRALVLDPDASDEGDLSWHRHELDAVLVAWANSTSAAEARRELARGVATPAEAIAFVERIPQGEFQDTERAALSSRLLADTGDWDQFVRSLDWLDAAASAPALETLDAVVLAFTKTSPFTDHPQRLRRYLSLTGRGGWPAAEGFIDAGLGAGGNAQTHVPLLLLELEPAGPAYYIRRVLDRETLLPHVRRALAEHLAR